MQVVRNLKRELTSLRLVADSYANDKSILESLKNKQNLIIISIFKYLRKLNYKNIDSIVTIDSIVAIGPFYSTYTLKVSMRPSW